ncbi:glycine--tRNA ligase subunit beta [candidate division WOR-3 bacterium]|nr:glycine--tRNA ligase subunit beta [candidate division WOR-3 bacterium]
MEIGTEEIPAGWLQNTSTQLANKICELLSKEGISHDEPEIFYTPRRIAVLIKNVATRQENKSIEITGPPKEVAFDKNGNLTKAGIGFAKAHKVSPSELKVKKKGKQEVIYYQKLQKGKETSEILESALQDIISQIEFPKSMRWESSGFRFARPIRWIVALLDKTVIPFEIAGVKSGEKSQGLRFASPIIIKSPDSYEKVLEESGVIANADKRLNLIMESIQKLIKGKDLTPEYGNLLEEVTNLVECPRAILGKFDEKYLKLPKEVIIAAMETHQRYFALEKKDKALAPYFVVIANTKDGDVDKIREGHERVLRARLEDAEFYFKEDMKVPLKKRLSELKEVVWQEGLGTLDDKTQRLIELSEYIADNFISIHINLKVLREAAELCKVDLLTNMIKDGKEFTKLEGLYGSILAKEQDLDSKVVIAIRERTAYLPDIETSPEGVALAIADRIDTIVGAFILGKIPTGSKDPLGIRRVGNELVSIITESARFVNALHIPLKSLISKTLSVYEKVQGSRFKVQGEKIFEFLIQRFRKYSLDESRYDIIDAVLEVPNDDIVDLLARINALNKLKDKEDFITLIRLAKRVRNILNKSQVSSLKSQVLKEPEEKELYDALMKGQDKFENYLEKRDYESALDWLLELAPLINNFFDKVLVMAKETDVRENRLALLNELYLSFQKIADFSKIVE